MCKNEISKYETKNFYYVIKFHDIFSFLLKSLLTCIRHDQNNQDGDFILFILRDKNIATADCPTSKTFGVGGKHIYHNPFEWVAKQTKNTHTWARLNRDNGITDLATHSNNDTKRIKNCFVPLVWRG